MEVNYLGVVHGSLFFLPELKTRPSANLVNVCSWTGLLAVSGSSPYAASKFAVRGFTDTLRMELSATPVRVTLVCPGLTRTAILDNSPDIDAEEALAMKKVSERRFVPGPEVVAAKVVDGIRRDRPRVLVGADTQIMDRVARLLPGSHSRLLHRPIAMLNSRL
jgi:short-subunit dehydrogenase